MNRHLSILLAGPSLFVLATAAVAQPATTPTPPTETKAVDEATQAQQANQAAQAGDEATIIITARRRAESLLDVPQTVTAVTSKQIQEYNLTKFQDISQLVPGLNLTTDNTGFGATASTRGVTSPVSAQGSPTVENYINEHAVEPNLLFQSQFDIGQIEVLKGPQGTLRGRSAPAGAITVTTRRPDLNEMGGSVSFLGNSHGGINMQAALGVPIIQDVLAVRVAGIIDHTDQGGVKSANNPRDPFGRTWAIRGTVRFEPTDTISAVVMGQRMHNHTSTFGSILFGNGALGVNTPATAGALNGSTTRGNALCTVATPCAVVLPGGRPAIQAPANFNGPALAGEDMMAIADFPSNILQTFDVVTAQLDWKFAGQKLSYVGGYSKETLDGTGAGADASNTVVGRPAQPLYIGNLSTEKRFTHELRLSSDERLFNMLDYTVGVYRGRTWGDTSSSTFTPWAGAFGSPLGTSAAGGPGLLSPFTFDSRYGLESYRNSYRNNIEKGLFGTVIGHLFHDKLELEAGGRKIWFSAGKSQETLFGGGLFAARNPNGLGACPATLSAVDNGGGTIVNGHVEGSTYRGTCDVRATVGNGIIATPAFPFATRKWHPFVYRLSASYHFTRDLMVYATRGTSWRAGPGPITGAPVCSASLTPSFPNLGLCDAFNFLNPEKSKSTEIGFKGAFFDRRLSVTVSGYKQSYDGFFVFALTNPSVYLSGVCTFPHIANVTQQPASCVPTTVGTEYNAPIRAKGIDADLNFRVSEDLNFGGGASWSKSKFGNANVPCRDTNFDGIPDAFSLTGVTGTQYLNAAAAAAGTANAPEAAYGVALCSTATNPALKPNASPSWNFNLRGEFSHDITSSAKAFIRALFNYTPKNKNLNPATQYIPKAYGILNLFAGIRAKDGAWEFSVAGRNILKNKTILTQGLQLQTLTRPPSGNLTAQPTEQFSFAPGTTNLSGYNTISYVARREFQVSARFAFGSR
jgi:iron complex outermembrane receptor protein